MKIAVFGATGKTGVEITKQALAKGHQVTAFVRDPARMTIKDDRLSFVVGDVNDPSLIDKAVQGQDAIVCALGSRDLKKTTVRTIGTQHIIKAMEQRSVRRLIVVSAMGTGESWDTLSLISKFFYAVLLKSAREDHESQEAIVKKSGLDWTIIRPSGLTDGPRTGNYQVGEKIYTKTSNISSADVADLILKELEQNVLIYKAVTITN